MIMRILFKKDDVGGGYKCDGCQTNFKDPEEFSVKSEQKLPKGEKSGKE
jgi:hypothetical protein